DYYRPYQCVVFDRALATSTVPAVQRLARLTMQHKPPTTIYAVSGDGLTTQAIDRTPVRKW
ncbi:hypothetical protein, partial [Pseudomonas viridiflava]|uniref:hypothetical protein n=1 Tax=Pseudomonas viridiflava TaxID=33069 RepID=UPI00197DED4A